MLPCKTLVYNNLTNYIHKWKNTSLSGLNINCNAKDKATWVRFSRQLYHFTSLTACYGDVIEYILRLMFRRRNILRQTLAAARYYFTGSLFHIFPHKYSHADLKVQIFINYSIYFNSYLPINNPPLPHQGIINRYRSLLVIQEARNNSSLYNTNYTYMQEVNISTRMRKRKSSAKTIRTLLATHTHTSYPTIPITCHYSLKLWACQQLAVYNSTMLLD